MLIEIPPELIKPAEAAIVRLGYLYPSLNFQLADEGIRVAGALPADISTLRKDALHAVYREKIYAETLAMRTAFISAMTRK